MGWGERAMLPEMLLIDRTCAAAPNCSREIRGERMLQDSAPLDLRSDLRSDLLINGRSDWQSRGQSQGQVWDPACAGPRGAGPIDETPGGPPPKRPVDPGRERDREVATKERRKSARPPRFKVILYNDNYTPMEFVVQVLEKVFGKSPSAATQIMLQIHKTGMGIGGVFVLEVAETKSATVLRMAEERGYPLRSGVEKE